MRALCLARPLVEERPSHGSPAWFHGGRQFAHYWLNHHQDGRQALWCAAPNGMQEALTAANPARFFVPPYVGHRGWLGLDLDHDPDWLEVEHVVGRAYEVVSSRRRSSHSRRASTPGPARRGST